MSDKTTSEQAYERGRKAFSDGHLSALSCASHEEYMSDELRQNRLLGFADAALDENAKKLREETIKANIENR